MTNLAGELTSPLFSPLKIGSLELPGRLIKTATVETRASNNGYVTAALLDFYGPLAQGGTPLIITGNIYTSVLGKSTPLQLGADDDSKIPGLAQLVDLVHAEKGLIFAQLSHCGRQVIPDFVAATDVVSASNVKDLMTGTKPRSLTEAEIQLLVSEFVNAAQRCQRAGFDGIQIHAAHGYLLSQFLTPHTNRRQDSYGGSLNNRCRLLREIVIAVRQRLGRQFPLIVKLNGADKLALRQGLSIADAVAAAKQLEAVGIDAVEISVGHYASGFPVTRGNFWRCLRAMASGNGRFLPILRRIGLQLFWPLLAVLCNLVWYPREGYNLRYSRRFKQQLSIPVIVVGGFLTESFMHRVLQRGDCDAISAGRAFIADPLWYRHLKTNTRGPRCVNCNACIGRVGTEPLDCYHPRIRAHKDAMLANES